MDFCSWGDVPGLSSVKAFAWGLRLQRFCRFRRTSARGSGTRIRDEGFRDWGFRV